MDIRMVKIRTNICSDKGSISFIESFSDIPFEIKRIYYTYNVKKSIQRGGHAHKNLNQILWCPFGKIKIILDNGSDKREVILDKPSKGLLVDKSIWHDVIWEQEDSVLLAAASDYYDESDYIRDYDEFLKLVKDGYWKNNEKINIALQLRDQNEN